MDEAHFTLADHAGEDVLLAQLRLPACVVSGRYDDAAGESHAGGVVDSALRPRAVPVQQPRPAVPRVDLSRRGDVADLSTGVRCDGADRRPRGADVATAVACRSRRADLPDQPEPRPRPR